MRLTPASLGRAAGALTLVLCAGPAIAQDLVHKTYLSAALAHEALVAAVETCARQGQQVSGVVLDPAGLQQAFLRGDGAGIHTVDTADYKANTTLSFRMDGIDLVERAKTRPPPGPIVRLPRLLLAQGGVLIWPATRSSAPSASAARAATTWTRLAHAPASTRSKTG